VTNYTIKLEALDYVGKVSNSFSILN